MLAAVNWRSLGIGLSTVLLLLSTACKSSNNDGPTDSETNGFGADNQSLRFNPSLRIGEVVWKNERDDFAVVRLDAPSQPFEPAFLLALDPAGTELAGVLIGGGAIEGRSFGARIVEGEISDGAEVRIPGPEWTEYLYNRYNQLDNLPPARR